MSQQTPSQGVIWKCPWMRDRPLREKRFLCVSLRLLLPPWPCTKWSLKWSLGVWLKFFYHFESFVINWTCLFSPFPSDAPESIRNSVRVDLLQQFVEQKTRWASLLEESFSAYHTSGASPQSSSILTVCIGSLLPVYYGGGHKDLKTDCRRWVSWDGQWWV